MYSIGCIDYSWKIRELAQYLLLSVSSVVDFSKKVLAFIVVSELLKVQGQDSPVNNEEDGKKTNIVNSEPLIGTIRGNGGCAGKNGRDGTRKSGNDSVLGKGIQGHGDGGNGLADTEGY